MEDSAMQIESQYAHLPTEILINIFQYLDFYDLQSAKCSCKQWFAVAKLQEFDAKGVVKITTCYLDNNHPAAEVIFNKRVEKLYLKSVQFGNVDNLFKHIGVSLKELALKLVPITDGLRLTFEYFKNLQTLKVSQIRQHNLLENLEELHCGILSQLKTLELAGNDTSVNCYLLNCSLGSDNLESLTIQLKKTDELAVLEAIQKHLHKLKLLSLCYNESALLEEQRWISLFPKLNLSELTLQGNFVRGILRSAIMDQNSLRSLNVAGSVMVDDGYLTLVARHLLRLETLSLAYCGQITYFGVKNLESLSHLKSLDMSYCNRLGSSGVRSFIGKSPNYTLLELNLAELFIDEETICFCANNLPNLRILNLSGCWKTLTDTAIQEIFDCQRNLRELKLDNCVKFSYNGFLGFDTGTSIQCLESLQRLSLRGCRQLQDDFLEHGLKLPQLKFLDITNCDKITEIGIEALATNCATIEELYITINKGLTLEALTPLIGRFKRLRRLSMNNVDDVKGAAMIKSNGRFRASMNDVTFTISQGQRLTLGGADP